MTLRADALARRTAAAAEAPDAARLVARNFLASFSLDDQSVVATYSAIGDELNPAPLVERLRHQVAAIALPVVERKNAPLTFRRWDETTQTAPGPFGIREPTQDAPVLRPTVLLVPLLLVDARGYRLGYGGGFYDRTIAGLRAAGPVLAIGLAYEAQCIDLLEAESWDEALDHLVTEVRARQFGG